MFKMGTKSRIMETTFKLVLKKGFTDVSLNEIIKASNTTTGGFYHHFNSKDALLLEVIEKYIFNYFNSSIERIRSFEGTPKEKLQTVILSIVAECVNINEVSSKKVYYRNLHLLLMEGVQKYDVIAENYKKFYHNLLNFIKEVIDEGVAQDMIRQDIDSHELAIFIQTSILGTIIMWIGMPEMPLEERMISNIDHLWNYMKK